MFQWNFAGKNRVHCQWCTEALSNWAALVRQIRLINLNLSEICKFEGRAVGLHIQKHRGYVWSFKVHNVTKFRRLLFFPPPSPVPLPQTLPLFPIPKHLFNSRSLVYSRGTRSPPWSPWPLLRSRLCEWDGGPHFKVPPFCALWQGASLTPLLCATPPTHLGYVPQPTRVLRIWLLVPALIIKLLSNSARLTHIEGGRIGWSGSSLLPQPRSEVVLPPLPLFRVKRVCLCVRVFPSSFLLSH